jgi:hypothetical protein
VAHFRLRPLDRPTRKYLKATRPSLAENGKPHFMQEILPYCASQVSIVTILYSASQSGQLKGIGFCLSQEFLIVSVHFEVPIF